MQRDSITPMQINIQRIPMRGTQPLVVLRVKAYLVVTEELLITEIMLTR